jgi:hypothetical protein
MTDYQFDKLLDLLRGMVAAYLAVTYDLTEKDKEEINRYLWAMGKDPKKEVPR